MTEAEPAASAPDFSDIDPVTHARIIEQLNRSSVATISHWLNQKGYRNSYIPRFTCVRPDLRLAGRARTMRLVPHRPDLSDLFLSREQNPHRKAVEHIRLGEVLVIDGHGSDEGGILGDIMSARLKANGAAGLVVDGCLRDVWQIKGLDLAVYTRHIHAGAINRGLSAVEMDGVVACGGCGVRPGDYLMGDPDGVAVIPASLAAEAAAYGAEHEALEEFLREKVIGGALLAEAYPPNDAMKAEYERRRGRPA